MSNEPSAFVPLSRPHIDPDDIDAVVGVLEGGWLTSGPVAEEFAARFAAAVGTQHAVPVTSCTAALHLALAVLDIGPGDEVITSPYTFAATAEVIRYRDAHPVFVDIDPRTFNLDPAGVERALTSRTRAIVPIHIAGLLADTDAIGKVAAAHDVTVVADAAHAFPAASAGRPVGALCDLTAFSFYATKTITTGEGGMLCTDHSGWAERAKRLSLHGLSRQAWSRHTAQGSWYYEVEEVGYKYNLPDLLAALGLAQLRKAERLRARREAIAARYSEALADLPGLELPAKPLPGDVHAWHLYMLRVDAEAVGISRDEVIGRLRDRGIGCSVHFIPLHLQPYYARTYGLAPEDFPLAAAEYAREVSLPLFAAMTDDEAERVIEAVRAIAGGRR